MPSDPLVWPDLLLWHIGVSFTRLPLGLFVLVLSVLRQQNHASTYEGPGFSQVDQVREIIRTLSLCISIPNDLFLSTLDCSRTNTFFGTAIAQQAIFLIANSTALIALCLLAHHNANFDFYVDWFLAIHVTLGVSLAASMFLPLSRAQEYKRPRRGRPWLSNAKDLMVGEPDYLAELSWLGMKRSPYSSVFSTRAAIFGTQVMRVIVTSFVRRVKPVETKSYAIVRNTAALLAIFALIMRAITLLAHAQSQVFQTIVRLEPCSWSNVSMSEVQIIISHPLYLNTLLPPELPYTVNISASWLTQTPGAGWSRNDVLCSPHSLPSSPINDPISSNYILTDWFEVYSCPVTSNTSLQYASYDITMRSSYGTPLDALDPPQFWLTLGTAQDLKRDQFNVTQIRSLTPWLVPAWQLAAGFHSLSEIGMAKRNFIDSSFLRDTVGGMQPIYQSVTLFPITETRTSPLSNTSLASGTLSPSKRSQFTTANNIQSIQKSKSNPHSLSQVCEVTEDYRASTAFDVLSSIGGLLALLQSIHILLFGRPMFWGIFGAKLISPFGLLGRWSSPGFRRRLREHYAVPTSEADDGDQDTMRLYAFLRDYIIDFGPADPEMNT